MKSSRGFERFSVRSIIQSQPRLQWLVQDIRSLLAASLSVPIKAGTSPKSNNAPFLFVVGAGRSGNTLFRRLLMERYRIYIPPETYVLPRVADYRFRGRGLAWPEFVNLAVSVFEYHPEFDTFEIESLRGFAEEARNYSSEKQTIQYLLCDLYSHFAKKSGVEYQWLGDKTPLNTLHLGRIDRIMPGSHFAYLLRDGIDVAASYVKAGIYNNIGDAAERWVRSQKSWESFRSKIPDERRMEIRYEELVAAPDETMKTVASFFGIPERNSVASVDSVLGDVGKHGHHENVTRRPSLDSVGKGRSAVSEADRQRLRPVFSGWLEHCGYQDI